MNHGSLVDGLSLRWIVGRGTTYINDIEYVIPDGSGGAYDLYYDVRSYFQPNGTFSPEHLWCITDANQGISPEKARGSQIPLVDVPHEYNIGNYPNPFNPSTTFSYRLVEDADVRLVVYDVMGRKVAALLQQHQAFGSHSVEWNGRNDLGSSVGSGVYFYQFSATPSTGRAVFKKSGKLLLTK